MANLSDGDITKWALGLIAAPVVWAVGSVVGLRERVGKLETSDELRGEQLDRMEGKLDRLLESRRQEEE